MNDGLQKGEMTYLTALIEIKPNQRMEVLDSVVDILEEFTVVMPLELPKTLPPGELLIAKSSWSPGTKSLTKAPYRVAPT